MLLAAVPVGAVTWGRSHGGAGYLGGQSHGVTHGGTCTCAPPLSSDKILSFLSSSAHIAAPRYCPCPLPPPSNLPPLPVVQHLVLQSLFYSPLWCRDMRPALPPSSYGTCLILQSFFCSSLRCDMRRLNARKARWIVMAARTSLSNLRNHQDVKHGEKEVMGQSMRWTWC